MTDLISYFYECPRHDIRIRAGLSCDECQVFLNTAPDPKTMSTLDKVKEVKFWFCDKRGTLSVPMPDLKRRLHALVGRPIYTYELLDVNKLLEEIITDIHPTEQEIAARYVDVMLKRE